MRRIIASLLAILWLPQIALSAPPDAKYIPSDSQWLVHFDFQRYLAASNATVPAD